jgi:uncharacterized membrane protein
MTDEEVTELCLADQQNFGFVPKAERKSIHYDRVPPIPLQNFAGSWGVSIFSFTGVACSLDGRSMSFWQPKPLTHNPFILLKPGGLSCVAAIQAPLIDDEAQNRQEEKDRL